MPDPLNRREFARLTATSAAALVAVHPLTGMAQSVKPEKTRPISVFTKPLVSLSFDELADRIAEAGFASIEAPIRRGGHVTPQQVPDKLPELVEALTARGLTLSIMTSDINDPDDPATETVLRTAATLGIPQYRMSYFKYDLKKDIVAQVREIRPKFKALAEMNHDFGIQGLYQNHAGRNYFGAAIWDLHPVLEGIPTADLGIAYDLRHAIAEGGMSWPTTLELIRDKIAALYIKDFKWDGDNLVNVPLGEGRVTQASYKSLHRSGDAAATQPLPISIHEEYLDHADPSLVPQHLAAMKRDLKTLQSWME